MISDGDKIEEEIEKQRKRESEIDGVRWKEKQYSDIKIKTNRI